MLIQAADTAISKIDCHTAFEALSVYRSKYRFVIDGVPKIEFEAIADITPYTIPKQLAVFLESSTLPNICLYITPPIIALVIELALRAKVVVRLAKIIVVFRSF